MAIDNLLLSCLAVTGTYVGLSLKGWPLSRGEKDGLGGVLTDRLLATKLKGSLAPDPLPLTPALVATQPMN